MAKSGKRFIANSGDKETLVGLSSWEREPVGRRGWVRFDGKRNLFTFEKAEGVVEKGARL
jgi:hypothetical protein